MRIAAVALILALAGCGAPQPGPSASCAGGVRVGGDARQGVVFEEGSGARLDSRIRTTFSVGACV